MRNLCPLRISAILDVMRRIEERDAAAVASGALRAYRPVTAGLSMQNFCLFQNLPRKSLRNRRKESATLGNRQRNSPFERVGTISIQWTFRSFCAYYISFISIRQVNMIRFSKSDSSIGFVARRETNGPEARMLRAFLKEFLKDLENDSRRGEIAVFYEPMLPTGFPDRVVVRYDERAFDGWNDSRETLITNDLKILHHLTLAGPVSSDCIRMTLGFDYRQIVQSLERLNKAGMVDLVAGRWKAKPASSTFGVKEITAIEAKISDWTGALQQASLNQTFATASYVLTPCFTPPPSAQCLAASRGIGIFAFSSAAGRRRIKAARSAFRPVSYTPWLFNEWIGRKLAKRRRSA